LFVERSFKEAGAMRVVPGKAAEGEGDFVAFFLMTCD